MVPATTSHHPRASLSRSSLPRTACQKPRWRRRQAIGDGGEIEAALDLPVKRQHLCNIKTGGGQIGQLELLSEVLEWQGLRPSDRQHGSGDSAGSTPSWRRFRSAKLVSLSSPGSS